VRYTTIFKSFVKEKLKRVLVVDDEPDVLEVFQRALELKGYKVFPLLSPQHIFKVIVDFKPDVIVLDIMLNGMDGRAVLSALKQKYETENIPVIMVSSRFTEEYIMQQETKPDIYFKKPFELSKLTNAVKELNGNQFVQ
jgi:DNA-binding response OmpR family regulator